MQIHFARDAVRCVRLRQMKIEMTYAQYEELRTSIILLRSSLLLELEKSQTVYKKLHDERITDATKALENTLEIA